MDGIKPVTTIVYNEQTPQNRKEVILMFYKAIKDASAKNNISEEINQTINFIVSSLPEIPEVEYSRDRIFTIEPSFNDVSKEYLKDINLLVPELIYRHIPLIRLRHKEKYLRLLQRERLTVEILLKEHTNWFFDKEVKSALGK